MNTEPFTEIEFGAQSDRGRMRGNNEDCFRAVPELGLFVLSDGMGGQASGEIASRMVCETVVEHCLDAAESTACSSRDCAADISELGNELSDAIRLANSAVRSAAEQIPEQSGMGATVVAVMLTEERVVIAHVGDSRAYRLRNGQLEQLTRDHSFVAEQIQQGLMSAHEAAQSNLQNVLMRAVGADAEVQVEVTEELFAEGDTLLLCSDGLTKELSDAQIAGVLASVEGPQEAADNLVDMANEAGGSDNITVIVLRNAPKFAGAFQRIGRWFKGS